RMAEATDRLITVSSGSSAIRRSAPRSLHGLHGFRIRRHVIAIAETGIPEHLLTAPSRTASHSGGHAASRRTAAERIAIGGLRMARPAISFRPEAWFQCRAYRRLRRARLRQ